MIVRPQTTIDETIRGMAVAPKQGGPAGIAVVVDDDGRLAGVVTDGDIRRAYVAGTPFSRPVHEIMVRDPITVPDTLPRHEVLRRMFSEVRGRRRLQSHKVDKIPVIDAEGRLVDILSFLDLAFENDVLAKRVVVVGVGQIGLPLAALLASVGFSVVGIDQNAELVDGYRAGRYRVLEPGLRDLVTETGKRGRLAFTTSWEEAEGEVVFVCVGTPVSPDASPDYTAVVEVAEQVGARLKHGDLVILRSTVSVGATRQIFQPVLEKASGLTAGKDFALAFAPERAVAGKVLEELRMLPQIVGGLTPRCVEEAARVLGQLTNFLVRVESLEAAEMVKLANNTFRDLCFAFANEFALLCAQFNLDAFDVIAAANEGYPRNTIPLPSPGVGGYCLVKDPHLYSHPFTNGAAFRPQLGLASRAIHKQVLEVVVNGVCDFARRTGRAPADLAILLLGIAFKGQPETADVRDSVAIDVARLLRAQGTREIRAYDFIVDATTIAQLGMRPTSLEEGFAGVDTVLVLNNHASHVKIDLMTLARSAQRPLLFFDGWHQFNKEAVRGIGDIVYATMGFRSEVD